jgi:hypothetical protein
MTTHFTGHCLCGAISYEFEGPPVVSAICHCTHCQRQAGSLFSMICGVPRAKMKVTGTPTVYLDTADSGRTVERHFCGKCGSPIFSVLQASQEMAYVKAGTIDQWQELKPTLEFYRTRSAEWLPQVPGAIAFAEGPPS